MTTSSDRIVIVGAGPIGLACALAAASLRNTVVDVIERRSFATTALTTVFDNRVYALSPSSRALLEELNVWQRLDAKRVAPIRTMQVFGDAEAHRSGELSLSQAHAGPLAFIVEHSALINALQSAVVDQGERIRVIDNTEVATIDFVEQDNSIEITLANQAMIEADLLIAADGSASRVRSMVGIGAETKDYDSEGVVANFEAERGHGGVARQWFSAQGVLAYLPLPDDQVSIVWSVSRARAVDLAALNDAAFSAAVAAAGDHALGELTLKSTRARIPLKRVTAMQWVMPGLALIGDAAHSIHPLAGQGANLGFSDVSALHAALRDRSPLSRAGDLAVLRQYERARREDAFLMSNITHNLRALYLSDAYSVKIVRRVGLNVIDRSSATKAMLIAQAIK